MLVEIAIFVPLILFGLSRVGAAILRKVENDESAYFAVMIGIVALASSLAHSLASDLPLVLSIVGALVVGKFAAAEIAGRMYGYTRDERLTVWSLTLPQVAATRVLIDF